MSKGLEGVIAGETQISNVEGDIGRLTYRGYPIESLVHCSYVSVVWLLLFGDLPEADECADLDAFLTAHNRLSARDLKLLECLPSELPPMKMLQVMIPALEIDAGYRFEGLDEEASHGLQIIARLPALIAAFRRRELGMPLLLPDNSSTYLGNFLQLFTGESVSAEHEAVLSVVQILQMEHSFNAGTFTTRVASSTLSSIDSVLVAGVAALSGVLHGGADEAALLDARRVGCPGAAAAFVDELLAKGGKLMGMGHREYRTVDPRSLILKPLAERLCAGTESETTFHTLVALEDAFSVRMEEKGKRVKANLEFYKGAVYEVLGIPPHYFTSVFAMSRMVGWLAHFIESRRDNRIMRPKANYVGPTCRQVA